MYRSKIQSIHEGIALHREKHVQREGLIGNSKLAGTSSIPVSQILTALCIICEQGRKKKRKEERLWHRTVEKVLYKTVENRRYLSRKIHKNCISKYRGSFEAVLSDSHPVCLGYIISSDAHPGCKHTSFSIPFHLTRKELTSGNKYLILCF